MTSRPPGRRTRKISSTACLRSDGSAMLCRHSAETTTSTDASSSVRLLASSVRTSTRPPDAFELCVVPGPRRVVAGQVLGDPQVRGDDPAGRDPLGRAHRQEAGAAADVEHVLVTAPRHQIEHAVTVGRLARPHVAQAEHSWDESCGAEHGRPESEASGPSRDRGHHRGGQQDRPSAEKADEIREAVDAVPGPLRHLRTVLGPASGRHLERLRELRGGEAGVARISSVHLRRTSGHHCRCDDDDPPPRPGDAT